MIDIGNIDLTYEDGLRLSELLGQRAELAYGLDHILMNSLVPLIAIAVLTVGMWVVACLLFTPYADKWGNKVYEDDEGYDTLKPRFSLLYKGEVETGTEWSSFYDPERHSLKYKQVKYEATPIRTAVNMAIPFIIIGVLAAMLIVGWCEYDLSRQIVGVDAQIEELLSRYGVI